MTATSKSLCSEPRLANLRIYPFQKLSSQISFHFGAFSDWGIQVIAAPRSVPSTLPLRYNLHAGATLEKAAALSLSVPLGRENFNLRINYSNSIHSLTSLILLFFFLFSFCYFSFFLIWTAESSKERVETGNYTFYNYPYHLYEGVLFNLLLAFQNISHVFSIMPSFLF